MISSRCRVPLTSALRRSMMTCSKSKLAGTKPIMMASRLHHPTTIRTLVTPSWNLAMPVKTIDVSGFCVKKLTRETDHHVRMELELSC